MFDSGAFSEDSTLLLTDWLAHVPEESKPLTRCFLSRIIKLAADSSRKEFSCVSGHYRSVNLAFSANSENDALKNIPAEELYIFPAGETYFTSSR